MSKHETIITFTFFILLSTLLAIAIYFGKPIGPTCDDPHYSPYMSECNINE